jgi:hypothetical protein
VRVAEEYSTERQTEFTVFNFKDTELKGVAMEPIDSVEGFMAYLEIMKIIHPLSIAANQI